MTLRRPPHASRRGRLVRLALAAAAGALAFPLVMAGPAWAALSGSDWTEQALPASYLVGNGMNGPALSPLSCVAGTGFCVAVVSDSANLVNGNFIGQAAVVTTDSGQHWSGFATLPWWAPATAAVPGRR
jgi:hypothetical protein